MPEYLEDPSILTKDRLKSALMANNVELPTGNPTKDVYVQLYLKNLTALNDQHHTGATLDAFSSDEELPPVVVTSRSRSSGRKSIKKTEKVRAEVLDVTDLTDEALKDELVKHGVDAGPIVASTRKVYEKKLQKLLDDGPAQVTQLVVTEIQVNHNGNSESDMYSDKEDEVAPEPEPEPEPVPEPEPEPVPVVERSLRSRGKTPVTTRSSSSSNKHHVRDQLMEEGDDDDDEESVLQVKRRSRRLSQRTIMPEDLRPSLNDQVHQKTKRRVSQRVDSPARAETPSTSNRHEKIAAVTQPKLQEEDFGLHLSKPNKDSSHRAAAVLDTALLEEPEWRTEPLRAAVRPKTKPEDQIPCDSAGKPSTPSSPLVPISRVDPLTFSPMCHISPIKRRESYQFGFRPTRGVEKIEASEQPPKVEETEVLKELFPNDIHSPTGITATCRRPIRGAAGRPVKSSNLWNDENHLFSPKITKTSSSSSYKESHVVHRVSSLPPASGAAAAYDSSIYSSSAKPLSAAPPAAQTKAAAPRMSLWKKLLLLAIIAAFLFLVYQAMETNTSGPFQSVPEVASDGAEVASESVA